MEKERGRFSDAITRNDEDLLLHYKHWFHLLIINMWVMEISKCMFIHSSNIH